VELRKSSNSKPGESVGSDQPSSVIRILLVVCLVVMPIHALWDLPLVGKKFQPPEIVFLLLFFVAVPYILRNRQRLWFSPVDIGVLVWLGVNIFSGLLSGLSVPIAFELIGTLYLTLLYFTIRLTVSEQWLKKFPDFMALTATIAALLGITGWCLKAAGIQTVLVDFQTLNGMPHNVYPILGNIVGRAKALTAGNNLLAHILMVGIFIKVADCWHKKEFSRINLLSLGIMLIGFLLTFSKAGIILLIGLVLVWYFSTGQGVKLYGRILTWVVVFVLFLLYNLITFFHPVRNNDPNIKALTGIFYARDTPIATVGSFDIMLTKYWIHNRVSLMAFEESFLLGIGPGEYRFFFQRLGMEGLVVFRPGEKASQARPHSTYLGALAQLGVPGVLAILLLWGLLGYGCYQIFQVKEFRGMAIGFSVSFFSTAISATAIDIMNFRHLWWLIAIFAVLWHSVRLQRTQYPLGIDQ
jgi:hypothetical protein